ncbi:putative UDP-Xyl: (mannosyl) glucuronoxylomannan/galactoxylomannan beta-1,2-xylosyltransferase [Penicillium oxalicum 114-2]|uniref:Putative UDP-Xyl: (Mannosyl) glucuronoxylomannan/galactoxylomannan beta-1,2-xylosyltransferase n=1 Tax=Penicillium oxalicum (strain 114-2 / CGMCC 5302) TaxID=933388 RepID=S7ZC46_PENO1|nr:putative UDP-Xyl: (mannosyl) glucuronoxylomannan/galactoxylomannan beta-1,2-xylosyltransferase [Penicillium oxalicum 114-2]
MRTQRLLLLLAIVFVACLSLVLLRPDRVPQNQTHVDDAPDHAPPEPIRHPQLHPDDASYPPEKAHPISTLMQTAQRSFDDVLARQSKSLADAVQEYQRRYKMHPPPHFDKWFQFAQAKGVKLVDEFDSIYHNLRPFWAVKPAVIRARARETLGFDNAVIGLLIRNGEVTLIEGGGDGRKWQREATVGMMKDFVKYLPDMDLVFNTHDEPRVVIPSEDLERLVQTATDHVIPAAFSRKSVTNAWSPRAADLNKGDRIDEVRTTRFNRFAHQPTWTNSRISCPADSPARSLNEDAPDEVEPYALGELGFVYNTTAFSDICYTPSLRDSYGFFDRPNAFDVVHDLFPVFSQSKISSFQDILYPSPWYWADKVPYNKNKDYRWDDKSNHMYWRGTTTGGFSRAGGWRRQHRQQFVDNVNSLADSKILTQQEDRSWVSQGVSRKSYRDLFDVKFTMIGQCDPDDCHAQEEYFDVVKAAGQQDAWAHKYLVDIDGNAFSGRFYAFLRSNSFVFKIAIFREWHEEWLKPWLHYVPLSLKGNEYVETMRYFTAEEEGRKAGPAIATKGQEWAQQVLRKDDLEVWFFRLLLEYGRLVDDQRDQIGFTL